MKGIMVTLLTFAMTGIVVGQQQETSNQSSGLKFGPKSTTTSAQSQSALKPYEISITSKDLEGLKQGFTLKSEIAPVDPTTKQRLSSNVVNGIAIVHQSNQGKLVPSVKLRGQDRGDGVLRFPLTATDISDLQASRLSCDFTSAERGKYKQVEFYYVDPNRTATNPTSNRVSSAQTPSPDYGNDNDFKFGPTAGSNRPNSQFGQTRVQPLPAPGPIEPGDVDFMGPVAPRPGQIAQQPRPWDRNTTNDRNPVFEPTNQWDRPKNDTVAEYRAQIAAEKARQERLANQAAIAEAEQLKRELDELKAQGIQYNNQRTNQRDGRVASNQPFQPNGSPVLNSPMTNTEYAQRQQLEAERNQFNSSIQYKTNQLSDWEKDLAYKEAQIKKEQQRLAALRTRPLYETDRIDDSRRGELVGGTDIIPVVTANPSSTTRLPHSTGPIIDSHSSPQRRLASNTVPTRSGGLDKYAASLPGTKQNGAANTNNTNRGLIGTSNRESKEMGFIYFMLLCSLGLNLYLAWISRGFYVRYHELADELRETFTTTM
jgi:hypothetical protein